MVTYEPQIRFRKDLSDEDQQGGRQAVASMAAHMAREADERARLVAERQAAVAALIGDREPVPGDEGVLRSVQVIRDALTADGTARRDQRRVPLTAFNVTLHQGLSALSDYDIEWHWTAPGAGGPDVSIAEKESGLMHIEGESAVGDDRIDAACGVAFRVTSDQPAMVQVRPLITFSWGYLTRAFGLGAHGEAEGGVNLAAWLPPNPVSVSGMNSIKLFRSAASPGELWQQTGDGTVSASEIAITFRADAEVTYYVNMGAWIRCDHTTGLLIPPNAGGFGSVDAKVPYVGIQRFLFG